MAELLNGTKASLAGEPVGHSVFAHPLPFNLIPHIDKFQVRVHWRNSVYSYRAERAELGLERTLTSTHQFGTFNCSAPHLRARTLHFRRATATQRKR